MAAPPRPDGVQSVIKALDLLEALAEAGGQLGLSDLAAELALPPPTIHRLVRTLLARSFVRQLPDRRYALGPALIPLGEAAGALNGAGAEPPDPTG
jgi:IclR family acetate operon transcriptional repressor